MVTRMHIWVHAPQVKDATLKKVKALEEQKEAVETERDALKASATSLQLPVATPQCMSGSMVHALAHAG